MTMGSEVFWEKRGRKEEENGRKKDPERGKHTERGRGSWNNFLKELALPEPALFQGFIFACTDGRENSRDCDSSLQIELWAQTPGYTWLCYSSAVWPWEGYLTFQSPHLQSTGNNSYLLKCLLSSREVRARERNSSSKMLSGLNLLVCLHWAVFTVIAHSGKRDYSVDAVNKTGSR